MFSDHTHPQRLRRRGILAAAAAVLAIGASTAVMAGPPSLVSATAMNGRIAFSSDRTGIQAIWTMNPDGSHPTQLTHHGLNVQDWWPVWSPDGTKIAFTRYIGTIKKAGSEAIYLMNADGSNLHRLSNLGEKVDDNVADFSPNGTKIAFTSDRNDPNRFTNSCRHIVGAPDCNWDIFVMNVDGSNQQQLTSDPAADTYPEFSPDGTKILFTSTRSGGNTGVYTMNRDGSNVQKLTPDSAQAGDANWSPDGRKITFLNNFCLCPFNSDVFTMNADGSGVRQLTSNIGTNLEPEYSPDGTKIVFANFAPVTSTSCCGPGDVVVINSADGSGQINLTNSPNIDDETPEWGTAPVVP